MKIYQFIKDKKANLSQLLIMTLGLYIFLIYFRDFLFTYQYILFSIPIPYHKVSIVGGGPALYLRDMGMLMWNVLVFVFLIKKYRSLFMLVFFFISILFFGIFLSIDMLQPALILSDIRIMNGLFAAVGVFYAMHYFLESNSHFALNKLLLMVVYLSAFDAIASIMEFSVRGWLVGFRVMGIFSNSQLNSYVLLMSIVILYLLYKYQHIGKKGFLPLLLLFSLGIITTGTRTSMVGMLLLNVVFLLSPLLQVKSPRVKLFFIYMLSIGSLVLFYMFINLASSLAGRGDLVEQNTEGSRLQLLSNAIDTLQAHGNIHFLFGEGVGWGSNIASTLMGSSIPNAYKVLDGTIAYALVHSGLFGLFILFYIMYKIYRTIDDNLTFAIIFMPIGLISMSANIFEIYAIILMLGLAISFDYQQKHINI